jgi:hypothetical protein
MDEPMLRRKIPHVTSLLAHQYISPRRSLTPHRIVKTPAVNQKSLSSFVIILFTGITPQKSDIKEPQDNL